MNPAPEARTLFGESLLSRLAALGGGLHAETLGTHLFVYSSKPFGLPRPEAIRSLFEIVDTVIAERQ
ncbi:hypothetical protein AX769_02200 [Frondihabitans sp. PAMC 28766]|nr:hypothetical protein AX769_02200 [Frondihabitans sp. PAMC 28766]